MLKPIKKAARVTGVPIGRSGPPPHYRFIADGLIVTDDRAVAWYAIDPVASQTWSDDELSDHIQKVISGTQNTLAGRKCHIRVMWGELTSGGYSPGYLDEDGELTPWAQARAESIDSWHLPERRVFIGVDIYERTTSIMNRALKNASDWVGANTRGIPEREYDYLRTAVNKLGMMLGETAWKARVAPVDSLTWMIASEFHRGQVPVMTSQTFMGARLARLTRGRAVPFPDHVRHYDSSGHEAEYTAHLALIEAPETMDVPGNGEWLLTLAGISRLGVKGEPDRVAVLPQADVRFRFMPQHEAVKYARKIRVDATDQENDARKSSAGEAAPDVKEARVAAEELEADAKHGRVKLVEWWAQLSVTETSREALAASIAAVKAHYAGQGITVEVLTDEQEPAWFQSMAGDRVRVDDFAQITDAEALFGSSFWCGSLAGEDTGPVIGYTTGATQRLVRLNPTEAPYNGQPPGVFLSGVAGNGKTTVVQLLALDAADMGAWVPVLDLKGDLSSEHGGIVKCAREFGIPATSVDVSEDFAGSADQLAISPLEDAQANAHDQLMMILPEQLQMAADAILREQIAALIESGEERTTAHLLERMATSDSDTTRSIARNLQSLGSGVYGAAIVGRRTASNPLSTNPGVHLIRFPGMTPPPADTPMSSWTLMQRLQAAVLRGFLMWISQIAATPDMRPLRKMVCVPESHLLLSSADGAAFFNTGMRMGRASGLVIAFDSQDTETTAAHTGVVEQIKTMFAFSQKTETQCAASAKMLGLAMDDKSIAMVRGISFDENGKKWAGHCYMSESGVVGSVQIAYPSTRVAELLNTDPKKAEKMEKAA